LTKARVQVNFRICWPKFGSNMPASDSMTGSKMASNMGGPNRPVFVFPSNLDFYLEDQTTHKRVLTLYNPYDSDIIFKVLCNNPKKYAVVEPEGRIAAQKCIDIVVRHVAVSPSAVQQTDKFRIQIFEDNSPGEVVGKRDVLATLHPGAYPQGVPDPSDVRHSASLPHHRAQALMPPNQGSNEANQAYATLNADQNLAYGQHPNLIACFAAIVCIIALFLPTEGESNNMLKDYPYLHLTVNQKLVFAYVLGLVTMAILRTT